jgi:PAS domain S-box-containing protein
MKPEELELFDKIPEIISIDNRENRIIWMNEFAVQVMGIPREKIFGMYMKDLFPAKADKYIEENNQIFSTGKPIFNIVDSLEIHGEFRWYKSTKIPFFDDNGVITEIVVFLMEITNNIRDIQARVESEFKYRNLFDMAPLAIIVLDLKGIIIDCNHKTLELVETSIENIINKPFFGLDFIEDTEKSLILQKFNDISNIVDTPVFQISLRIKGKTNAKTIEVHPYILEKEGEPYAIQVIALDITKEKRHEWELEQNEVILKKERDFALKLSTVYTIEELAKIFVETSLDISGMDFGGLIMYDKISDSFFLKYQKNYPESIQIMLNLYTTDNMMKKAFFLKSIRYMDYKVIRTIKNEQFQTQGFKSILSFPIMVKDEVFGRLNVASHVIEDIPKTTRDFLDLIVQQIGGVVLRIQSQEEVKFNEQRLQVLLDLSQMSEKPNQTITDFALKEAVRLTKSRFGCIAWVMPNEKQLELSSWTNDGFMEINSTKNHSHINISDLGLLGTSVEKRKVIIRNDVIQNSELSISNQYVQDPIRRFISVPVFYGDKIVAVAGIANKVEDYNESDVRQLTLITDNMWNILEKKQAKEKMETENLKIQKLESLGILAGGIAHDFNNILTAILGNISLIELSVDDTKEITARIDDAKIALLQAKDLTHQLLTFSKGGAPIKKLDTIADLLIDTSQFMLRGSNIKPEFHISKDIWSVEIDKTQISQVINNLVLNAMQAMPSGGIITITAENFDLKESSLLPLEQGTYVKITIQDEGIGIPERFLSKIFDPYFTTKEKGSGLGLATSYSILKKHGGYITVESEVGMGSTFFIYLPAYPGKFIQQQPKSEAISRGAGRILVMDDDASVRKVANILLRKIGYDVETAEDGEQAIETYSHNMKSGTKFDLVIMDLTVPGGMGGKEAIIEILKIDPTACAIVSSGYYTDSVMADFQKYGFKGVIAKPYKLEEISKIINDVIRKKK